MDVNYIYTSKKKDFGKPCHFSDFGPSFVTEIDPNPNFKSEFYVMSTVDREIDNTSKICAHEVNTVTYPTESRGMNHVEGGWPGTVDNTDEDSMARFRKKIEKDKSYTNAVKSLGDFLENFIMENNSIDIYEEYFEGERIKSDSGTSITAVNTFQDLNGNYRNVVDVSWSKCSTKFAAIYALKKSNVCPLNPCIESYVWDTENNAKPICVLKPEVQISVVEFSPTNASLLVCGYDSGQVALWDIRLGGQAQQISTVIRSHIEKVTGLKWLHSKQETSFFSASTDKKIMSWDARNLSYPTETVVLDNKKGDFPNLEEPYFVTCVEYDATVPDNFMVGTQQGVVLSFRRRYKEDNEKLMSQYDCQSGPLIAVERNAYFPQLFISCDAWSLKLWSETVTNMPVLNVMTQDGYFTDTGWSPTRASTLYTTKTTGILEIWDLPAKNKEALLKVRLDDEALLTVALEQMGHQAVCGASSGTAYLVNIPEYLRNSSELETDLVKGCLRECGKIAGGNPRSDRIFQQEMDSTTEIGIDDDWWDPPEKAEDLYEEYKILFKDFLLEKVD